METLLSGPVTDRPSGTLHNDTGAIGWGLSWRMHAYLLMAEATGDPGLIRRLARMADSVVAARDHLRGVHEYRGLRLPVWSSAGPYTVATATVPDGTGVDALHVHLCPPHTADAVVEVTPAGDDRFDLTVTRAGGRPPVRLTQLSLDPDDPRRADHVAYREHRPAAPVTVDLPGPTVTSTARPRPGRYPCRPARVALAAQTGMITYPLAGLARLARERPDVVPADVAGRVDDYLAVVHDALAVHDHQWRISAEGDAHYTWLPDEPVSFAGAELPTNEFLAVGRTLVQLAAVTGDRCYVDRAAALAHTLRRQFQPHGDALVWPYWPSFGRVHRGWRRTGDPTADGSRYRPEFHAVPKAEDVTHALIDIDFAVLYHSTPQLPGVFTDADLRALGRTFTRHVHFRRLGLRPTVRHDVSGHGRPGTPRHEAHVAGWLPLARWEPGVRRAVAAVHRHRRAVPVMGVDAYCAALLTRWG
ncbi:hypothetical protein [Micromonospora echinofusca]|uniref:Uncharacterized protein n=1 Tax=Micromonospora echinofusca TaxID=47858 RepID=A0ABS3VPU9_MICEH|nr:hypothetical protein [Micromonospora echinofusca]MBO4206516.1 hypothetical protein [Micromonospora echinofusca]